MNVLPGKAKRAILSATIGKYKFRVDYEATLKGGVLANYYPTVQGHHFWHCDI